MKTYDTFKTIKMLTPPLYPQTKGSWGTWDRGERYSGRPDRRSRVRVPCHCQKQGW